MKIFNLNKCKSIFCLVIVTLIGFNSMAQSQEVSVLDGKITASNPDVEKIHVINLDLEKGAVTDAQGNFQILAKLNDSLYISSVQYQNRSIVVTEEMIASKTINIELQDKLNELAEVVIDDIKLSGHLASDINKISITKVETKNRLQNSLNDFIEKDKKLNPYGEANPVGGIRIDKIAGAVIDKLSKDSETPRSYTSKELANKSIQIVGLEFFREDLRLNENEICNFLFYCTEDTRFKHLVINKSAFVLIEYFQTKIEDFRDLRGSALNTKRQIPG
ncbi:carboxypeptidase-like regulatory domain-containing protein [Christiangramia sp. SM2212]|uniref:Carboxypeptidase-like regulatory domain-containing protein n=1 Tax=Christiangramia sediminicola TaxID=3073267 RepID=A0ABU1ETY8_9FLAO|nr:carboxypeptidase-like regulatory domain-containing protein [Christiangramia sp. SM2212]MDR5591851.1 carboxypeptidase-like regulatory domain-containing protein [Christiangramia sp. SM2212]